MNRFYLLILLFCFSCSVIINHSLESGGFYEKDVITRKIKKGDKEVVFIPMKHVGPPVFYQQVSKISDSLIKKGYYFFLEGVSAKPPKNKTDSLKLDTIARKIRKIWGRSLSYNSSKGGSFDTINAILSINGRKIKLKEKITIQPRYAEMGIDSLGSRNVDVDAQRYLNAFESKFVKVNLDSCDLQTPLNSKYECTPIDWKYRKKVKKEINLKFRNEFVTNEILKDSHSKIAVIYGAAHIEGIIELLEKEGYQKVD